MSDSSRTRSSRTTPIASTERIQSRLAFGLFTAIVLCATVALPALATVIESVSNRGRNVIKRYTVDGTPSGIALGSDGRLYVGIVDSQSVIVIDPVHDRLTEEVVLDDPRIAATKELVTMRIDEKRSRLVIAQGSDESVTILTLPELKVEREITMEGELIRDAVPDPLGRYLFVLGRDVHIFDTAGESVIRTIREVDPMAIAVSDDGAFLAVVGAEEFTAGRATVVSLWELEGLREVSRDPLQTDREIRAATFAADGQAIMALADDWLGEKPVVSRKESMKVAENGSGRQRIEIGFGDLISSERICLSDSAGAQAITTDQTGRIVYFPEKRCDSSGGFTASKRTVAAASLYGTNGRAIALDPRSGDLWATEPDGTITLYRAPAPRAP